MCFHLDGIVQGYELIKTEDIPRITNSTFSPSVIRQTAESLLEFLKRNCTKEGGTYWLFKAAGDDVVKLYDLSNLRSDEANSVPWQDGSENPFAYPVAMLLYRAAKNMSQSKTENNPASILRLLINCLRLLDRKHHPDLYSSVSYMIVELLLLPDLDTRPIPELSNGSQDRLLQAIGYLEGGLRSLKALESGASEASSSPPKSASKGESPPTTQQATSLKSRYRTMLWKMAHTFWTLGRHYFEADHLGRALACAYKGAEVIEDSKEGQLEEQELQQEIMTLFGDASFG